MGAKGKKERHDYQNLTERVASNKITINNSKYSPRCEAERVPTRGQRNGRRSSCRRLDAACLHRSERNPRGLWASGHCNVSERKMWQPGTDHASSIKSALYELLGSIVLDERTVDARAPLLFFFWAQSVLQVSKDSLRFNALNICKVLCLKALPK